MSADRGLTSDDNANLAGIDGWLLLAAINLVIYPFVDMIRWFQLLASASTFDTLVSPPSVFLFGMIIFDAIAADRFFSKHPTVRPLLVSFYAARGCRFVARGRRPNRTRHAAAATNSVGSLDLVLLLFGACSKDFWSRPTQRAAVVLSRRSHRHSGHRPSR